MKFLMKLLQLCMTVGVIANAQGMIFQNDVRFGNNFLCDITTHTTGSHRQRGFVYIKTSYTLVFKKDVRLRIKKNIGTVKLDCIDIFSPVPKRRVFIDSFYVNHEQEAIMEYLLNFIKNLGDVSNVWLKQDRCGVLDVRQRILDLGLSIENGERFYVVNDRAWRC